MATDAELESIIKLPIYYTVKNKNSVFLTITDKYAKAAGWKNAEAVIGGTDYDAPSDAVKMADSFIELDRLCIAANKPLHAIHVTRYVDRWYYMLSERLAITDEAGNVVQISCNAIEITNTNLTKGLMLLNQGNSKVIHTYNKQANYIVNSEHCRLPLTKKQELCLFLLIRGKSNKMIAKILNLSVRTVEAHMDAIKARLHCYSKNQLIEKAIDSGFYYFIPEELLNQLSMIELGP